MTWQIVFYSRVTGDISRKRNYRRWQDADEALRKNGFTEDSSGVWVAEGWLAKIREDKSNEKIRANERIRDKRFWS